MRTPLYLTIGLSLIVFPALAQAQGSQPAAAPTITVVSQEAYFPTRWVWETRTPAQVGMNAAKIQDAIDFAVAGETTAPRDLGVGHPLSWGREPFDEAVGPLKERGAMSGVIVKDGYVVASWGEPDRVDMTFSVTKTFLSTTVGLAWDRGLIEDVHDPVRAYMPPLVLPEGDGEPEAPSTRSTPSTAPVLLFESEHNRGITWDHMLRQTSAWRGTLWGKPDWADRPSQERSEWLSPERATPGSEWEYNDVRVNLLALVATNVWRRPLPDILRELVMDPIGASNTWRWHGYNNSWITMDGKKVQAVSGGGHWGGGMYVNAMDMARLGYLFLRQGMWDGTRIISEDWIEMAETPTPVRTGYGFMNFFLNTDRETYPSAPESAYAFHGAGSNRVYVDRENDLVIVVRWIEGAQVDGVIARVLESMDSRTTEAGTP